MTIQHHRILVPIWIRPLAPLLVGFLVIAGLFGILRAHGLAADASPQAACPTGTLLVPQSFTITVDLQRPNADPPDPSWAVPVHFVLHPPGDANTICHEWNLDLDQYGRFSGQLDAFTGVYDARIKNIHTLRNVRRDVEISATNRIDMGTLREGDANDDNRVQLLDFGILRNAYGTAQGEPDFDARADFDENDAINLRDFGLLRLNYGDAGDVEIASANAGTTNPSLTAAQGVTISVQPPTTTLQLGDQGAVTITVHAGAHEAVGAEFDLHFDPALLDVVDADPGADGLQVEPAGPFPDVLINRVDVLTQTARVRYGAGTFGAPVTGTFPLAVVRFQGAAPTPSTRLTFTSADAIDPLGTSIFDQAHGGAVTVIGDLHTCYLPFVARDR